MPTSEGASPLEAVLSFYSTIVTITSEGDSMVSDDTLEGLGTTGFLFQALFGSLLKLADPDQLYHPQPPTATSTSSIERFSSEAARSAIAEDDDWLARTDMAAAVRATDNAIKNLMAQMEEEDALNTHPEPRSAIASARSRLTEFLPEPGYFLAGAISGGVSRTTTAPLDRLKVFLLVNTQSSATPALDAVKKGQPLKAVEGAGKPIRDAVVTLWRAGGFRTFFAGKAAGVPTFVSPLPVAGADINDRKWSQRSQDHA